MQGHEATIEQLAELDAQARVRAGAPQLNPAGPRRTVLSRGTRRRDSGS
jgi:hypothetical protein